MKLRNDLSASDTNKLWLVYLDMVDILHMNLTAERTGNWELYLHSCRCMLPYFAATGHNNYTKSLYWFLQEMQELKPTVLQQFKDGFFVVRRTNQYWSAVSPDLCIEQTLMASLKGSSGLTRGRSLTEVSRLVWVLSRSGVLAIDSKLRSMTNVRFRSSDQHIEIKTARSSRVKKYTDDVKVVEDFCKSRHLLMADSLTNTDKRLKNVANGLIAPNSVNVISVKEYGEKIIAKMSGKSPLTFSFQRKDQAKQIPMSSAVGERSPGFTIDSELLFQRLICVHSDDPDVFKYELAHYPMSLFTDNGFMQESNKSTLAKFILEKYTIPDVIPNFKNGLWIIVLDGGLLLHKVPWTVGSKFVDIIRSYIQTVDRYGGKNVVVIFDGYLNSNTKDHCHKRRNPIQSMEMLCALDTALDCRKDLFLSNSKNKQAFVNLLAEKLVDAGYKTFCHENDADTLVVQKTFDFLSDSNVLVIADDTDILMLLLSYMTDQLTHRVYLQREKSGDVINIFNLWLSIPEAKIKSLLLCHALTGCDTTSGIHNVGKSKLFKNEILETESDAVEIFYEAGSSSADIKTAGEKLLLPLICKNRAVSLDELRFTLYKERLSSNTKKTKVDPRNLPPSSSAASFHSLRTYHQLQEWLGRSLDPRNYGWFETEGSLEPITFDGPIAPADVLESISCKCKKSNCKSGRCSCNAFGLICTEMCSCTDICENQRIAQDTCIDDITGDNVADNMMEM